MARHRIGIIIPALNEAATIVSVVGRANQFGTVIVVDDGSNDETANLAQNSGAVVIKKRITSGYDCAINAGFAYAAEEGYEYVITMDADGQHDPQIVEMFRRKLDEGADVVIGDRENRQRFAEHIFSWVAVRKWGIKDPLCGMKAYRIEIYKALGHFDSYGSIGTELAIYAAKNNKNIAQVAIKTYPRLDQPRFGRKWSANKRILRALFLASVIDNEV